MSECFITIWNHSEDEKTVITSGGNVTTIGGGGMIERVPLFAEEILKAANESGVPFSKEPPKTLIVGNAKFSSAPRVVSVPLVMFDRENLLRLDKKLLMRIADVVGCAPLFDEASTPKKAIVDEIAKATKIFDLLGATVPPTVTGEKETASSEQQGAKA
jgi:hypothetical protein